MISFYLFLCVWNHALKTDVHSVYLCKKYTFLIQMTVPLVRILTIFLCWTNGFICTIECSIWRRANIAEKRWKYISIEAFCNCIENINIYDDVGIISSVIITGCTLVAGVFLPNPMIYILGCWWTLFTFIITVLLYMTVIFIRELPWINNWTEYELCANYTTINWHYNSMFFLYFQ